MKRFKTLMMAVFTILSVPVSSQQIANTTPINFMQGKAEVIYACPMHPKVTSNKPGQCSQCNMHLKEALPAPYFSCPMHPAVTSDQPVKCNSCGMDLVPASREKINSTKKYACLMHTDVMSHEPGSCPRCKLELKANHG